MIHPPLPIDQNIQAAGEEEASELTATAAASHPCFREIMNAISTEDDEEKEPTSDRVCSQAFFASPQTTVLQPATLSGPVSGSASLQASKEAPDAHSQTWQVILESASQGISHALAEEMTETTLNLDGPRFAGTPLAGTKLIVREYSTAPLAFNIHFACSPVGLAFLQPQLKTLSTLFQSRRYPFSIHSVDADLGDGVPTPIARDMGSGDDGQHERRQG